MYVKIDFSTLKVSLGLNIGLILFKINKMAFLAGTMDGAEEKEKQIPAVLETLRKKRRNFKVEDQASGKEVCPKDASNGKEEVHLWKS